MDLNNDTSLNFHQFLHLGSTIRAQHSAGEFLSTAEAKLIREEWWSHVGKHYEKYRTRNADKTILSFFDVSGEWSAPWREAGYNVIQFDLQTGQDALEFSVEHFFEEWEFGEVYGILAACPCTDFSSSGAQYWPAKDADGRTEMSVELVRQTLRAVELFDPEFWVIENPVGRIQKMCDLNDPTLTFQPHHYGDPYTKKTMLWGNFDAQLPGCNVDPVEGSKILKTGGKSARTKNIRSKTPEGFSLAFFLANQPIKHKV